MRVLINGITGMLGHQVYLNLKKFNRYEIFGIGNSDINNDKFSIFNGFNNYIKFNFLKDENLFKILYDINPTVIINCMGMVKQREASNEDMFYLNSVIPKQLKVYCDDNNSKLIHISSDCVFTGENGSYNELDIPDAKDSYGMSKYLGEVYSNTKSNIITIRTSIIGPELIRDSGLLSFIFSNRDGTIHGYKNAHFSGLTTIVLAEEIRKMIEDHFSIFWKKSLVHISGEGITKYDLLSRINNVFKLNVSMIPIDEPVLDRTLNDSFYRETTRTVRPKWDSMLLQLKDSL